MTARGDEFAEFASANREALMRSASLLVGDRHAGEDLVQDALVRLYQAWSRVRPETALAYARQIMVNLAKDTYRARSRRPQTVGIDDPSWARRDEPVSTDAFAGVDDRDDIVRRLAMLAPRERTMVVMRFYFDYTEARVAKELGVSVGTVKSTTSRALAKLHATDDARSHSLGGGR